MFGLSWLVMAAFRGVIVPLGRVLSWIGGYVMLPYEWAERRYVNGALAGTERWTAILTVVLQPPKTEEKLRKNPLGIYVNGLSWSRELDSSEGAKP